MKARVDFLSAQSSLGAGFIETSSTHAGECDKLVLGEISIATIWLWQLVAGTVNLEIDPLRPIASGSFGTDVLSDALHNIRMLMSDDLAPLLPADFHRTA